MVRTIAAQDDLDAFLPDHALGLPGGLRAVEGVNPEFGNWTAEHEDRADLERLPRSVVVRAHANLSRCSGRGADEVAARLVARGSASADAPSEHRTRRVSDHSLPRPAFFLLAISVKRN